MSATVRNVEFAFTVDDPEHWTAEELSRCDADDPGSYDDWVTLQVHNVMRAAGEEFIADHPSLFRGEYLI